jgi:hypothetical protein
MAMEKETSRVNVTLDQEHAVKLRAMAERMHMNEGTLARSLLSTAIDEADPDPLDIAALLDGIDGAFEHAQLGRAQIAEGRGIPLEEF